MINVKKAIVFLAFLIFVALCLVYHDHGDGARRLFSDEDLWHESWGRKLLHYNCDV